MTTEWITDLNRGDWFEVPDHAYSPASGEWASFESIERLGPSFDEWLTFVCIPEGDDVAVPGHIHDSDIRVEIATDQRNRLEQAEAESTWRACRRSVPATELANVPDDATVWACWQEPDTGRSVTIYKSGDRYDVFARADNIATRVLEDGDQDEARRTAQKVRDGTQTSW